MRKFLFFAIAVWIISSGIIHPHQYEWRFIVKNSSQQWCAVHVDLYRYYSSTKTTSFLYHNDTKTSAQCDCNGGCDINDQGDGGSECPNVKMWNTLEFSGDYVVYLVVMDEEYYCLLKVPDADEGADFEFHYNPVTHDLGLESNQRNAEILDEGVYTEYSFTIQNDFGGGLGGGKLKLGNQDSLSSPQYPEYGSWTWSRTATAYNYQIIQGFKREFTEWQKGLINKSYNLAFTLDKEDNIIYTAKFNPLYTVTIQNELPGYGNSGNITVEGSPESSPFSLDVVQGEDFTAAGITLTIDNVQFTFDEWYKNGSPTQETSPFEPSGNDTYTALYNAKPQSWSRQLTSPSDVGELIELNWNEHPCSLVSYKIYRKVGSSGTPVFLASVAHGVGEWTESDYVRSGSTSDPLLQYDVRPYYSLTTTEGDPNFENVAYGYIEASIQQTDAGLQAAVAEEINTNYYIGSYPNPFNPQTTIRYSLPAAGYVSLKVYDSIGKEIVELVNEVKEAGSYSVVFDGTDLASGIYIYSIQVNDFLQSGKLLLLK